MITYIGKIRHNGAVLVSDPCYPPEHTGRTDGLVAIVNGLEPGEWHAFTDLQDTGSWGTRTLRLYLYLAKEMRSPHDQRLSRETVARGLGVDSGQMMICDLDAARAWPDDDEHTEYLSRDGEHGPDQGHADRLTYTGACVATEDDQQAGIIGGVAVVSRSGYGDGSYPLNVFRDRNGKIVALEVDFDPEEDEEDEEDEEES